MFLELMGTIMSQEDQDFIDQPSEDADLRAVELSNVSYWVCVVVYFVNLMFRSVV